MKDIKSVFEKMGLVEKVQVGTPAGNGLASQEPGEVHAEIAAGAKENTRGNREELKEPAGDLEIRKLMRADEIYENYNIKSQGINSLFIIESYLKALPDYLPNDVKRGSVQNIISSSGMNIENLLTDGKEKLKCLKSFSQSFSHEVKDAVIAYEDEIKKLSGIISKYNKVIGDIKNLEEEQVAVIDYEIEKINNIVQFMAPGN